jgi:ABC-type sugar transport system ATPase subunit
MNFLRGQVGADGTVSAGENFRLLLSKERSAAALQKGINVCIGVRPEHLVIERNPESATRNVIKGVVEVVEPQGATSILAAVSPWAWLKPELQSAFWRVMRRRTNAS